MRKIAGVGFSATVSEMSAATALFTKAFDTIESWQNWKGALQAGVAEGNFVLNDGRVATLTKSLDNVDDGGRLLSMRINERSHASLFETYIRLGCADRHVGFSCEIRVGAPALGEQPHFDAHIPRFVRDVIGLSPSWAVGDMPAADRSIAFIGASGGNELAQVLWHQDRTVPIVVVSEHHGVHLSPGIHDLLAGDLAGVALVARIDTEASWQMSALRGTEWSCYNGAIRLYYPRPSNSKDPFEHPLWTPQRLFSETNSAEEVVRRIRAIIRRRALSFSAYSTYVAPPLEELERRISAARLLDARKSVSADKDWDELERLYAKENDRLHEDLRRRDAEIADLRLQVANLQGALQWRGPEGEDAPEAEHVAPPATVSEAVTRAMALFTEEITFGHDVAAAAADVDADAGPPEKILRYLEALADMAKARRAGPLGTGQLAWLATNKGVLGSDEALGVRNSDSEMAKRTYHDGSSRRPFTLHLKPNEATSPSRCIRIYFDYDDQAKKVIVGHVGRHP